MGLNIRAIGTFVFYIVMLTLVSIFTGGIADQAQFGSDRVCLLFVGNYHNGGAGWVLDADSPACGIAVGIGILGIIITSGLGIISTWFAFTDKHRAKRLILAFAVLASLYTIVILVGVAVASAGIKKSCHEFEEARQKESCSKIFSDGFTADDNDYLEHKNLGTIKAAVTCGWMLTLGWLVHAASEWWTWKKASERWW
ncbi:hypothetical protein BC832DRAFT_77856 [Gaertneriomyces semiglobifer]|nr:hypothetical protein BC832DRAFT_77856 [Gaertneriomyces semiglobifer]